MNRIMKGIDEARCFPEDFEHENGNYLCRCNVCGHAFQGYKRRAVCRVCQTKDANLVPSAK